VNGTPAPRSGSLRAAWIAAVGVAVGLRVWNALTSELMWGYDAWGHVAYMLFIDLYHAFPRADQGWSYYQPPLHYVLGAGLAQLGRGELLVRGLSLLASLASLGIAALAALLARRAAPGRPGLALVAFCAVAFLPVQLYMGGMPGNELGVAFFNSAAVASFVWNQQRERRSIGLDGLTGVLLALALLTKHTGLVAVCAVGLSLLVLELWEGDVRAALRRLVPRALVLGAAVAAIAGPHYLRNVAAYGKPIPTNRDYPLVAQVEAPQPPGVRRLSDYLRVAPRMFVDANPLAQPMQHSILSTTYMSAWSEIHRESDRGRALEAELGTRPATTLMGLLGLLPTALALAGAVLAARDAMRGRRRGLYVPLLGLGAVMLGVYALFLWNVPIWAAVKAAYCLSLSLPFALFLVRGIEGLEACAARRSLAKTAVPAALGALGVVAVASAVVGASGVVLERRRDAPAMGAVHYYFDELEAARRVYAPYLEEASYKAPWLENLAAVELALGNAARARSLYERAAELAQRAGLEDPQRGGRIAVALALSGELEPARSRFDAILEARDLPEARANRGALRAALGDLAGAEADLRAALAAEPSLAPALHNLVQLKATRGTAERLPKWVVPRGYPYGIGTGEVLEWGIGRRPLLLLVDGDLVLARPSFYRAARGR